MMTRRDFVQKTVLAAAAAPLLSSLAAPEAWAATSSHKTSSTASSAPASSTPAAGPFKLPPLGYPVDALEPYIDSKTMQLHHGKHHAAYVSKLNAALVDYPDLGKRPIEELLYSLETVPEPVRNSVRNQGGGHYNHTLLWLSLSKSGGKPSKELRAALEKNFQSMNAFEETFTKAALDVFGSGWAWLVMAKDGTLSIEKTQNQDTPLSWGKRPLLGIDVWEHAYYLKYQNRRPDYVNAFLKVVNWDFVSGVHGALMKT